MRAQTGEEPGRFILGGCCSLIERNESQLPPVRCDSGLKDRQPEVDGWRRERERKNKINLDLFPSVTYHIIYS